jgi:MYXO-CTERM domain-containing protein
VTLASTGNLQQTQCVDVHSGAVYACSSQFAPDNAAVARSDDGAKQFSSILNYVDTVGPVECPAGTPVGDLCPAYWYMYGAQLGIAFDGGVSSPDMGPMTMEHHGCSCSFAPGPVGGALGGFFLLFAVAALARRRRR